MRPWICAAIVFGCAGCGGEPPSSDSRQPGAKGFILRTGEGESLQNGIVVKASPATGTQRSILVEQTFPRGGRTSLHLHEQGDELFYVVAGHGTATLGDTTDEIHPGDVVFVPRSAAHSIQNLDSDGPLRVVFFMDSPELVEEFRAIHNRVTLEPDRPVTPEERAAIRERIGGSRAVPRREAPP